MMNKIRLTNYKFPGQVKTEINGVEMQDVTNIELSCPVDGFPTLRLEQFATENLDVTVEGLVQPIISVKDPRLELHVEHVDPTHTRYWAEVRK